MCLKKLFKRVEKMTKAMKWYDVSLFKLVMLFAAFFLVTVWPQLNTLVHNVHWGIWLALMIIFAIPLWKKMC